MRLVPKVKFEKVEEEERPTRVSVPAAMTRMLAQQRPQPRQPAAAAGPWCRA